MKKRSIKHGIAIVGIAVLAFLAIASTESTPSSIASTPVRTPAPATTTAARPSGGSIFSGNGNRYEVVNQSTTWEEAKREAERRGGYLATITSAAENVFVLNLITSQGNIDFYWLGGQADSSRKWSWVTGESFSYTNWGNGNPDNSEGRQDKISIARVNFPWANVGEWDDENNNIKYGFVIEYPVGQSASAPPPPPPSPYFTGTGGRGIRLGIIVPESQGLSAQQAYLPVMVQGVLVSNISRYSGISVLDRVSLDRVIAETLDPTYEDNLDIVRLGHVAQVGHMLTGKITRTTSGFTLQLNVTDTTPNAATLASYSGTCTAAQLDDHTAVQTAARELLTQMGVVLTDKAVADLGAANAQQTVAAQTTLARGIVAEKQGNQNAALDYYTQAATLDSALPEAAVRFSALADRIQGTRLAEKLDWLRAFAQTGGKYMFEINTDEDIPAQTLAFSGKNNITLTLRGRGANRTISNGFTVSSGVTLILDNNITLRGLVRVSSGGTLIMNTGSAIAGNTGSSSRRDRGVRVSGTFTMNGGIITGNRGGVYVNDSGIFTMNGGNISSNSLSLGSLSSSEGGGVIVSGGTFTMNGGTVSGNAADYGGGVCNYGTFTMSGGEISGNTAMNGGGVYNSRTFTMSSGTISDNNARYTDIGGGGGVFNNGTFTMRNGTISGNTTRGSGGGVYVSPLDGTFMVEGGKISDNTASVSGGGVSGDLTMRGGTISGNTAGGNGGGVSGSLTMRGGTISGNTARGSGGGVFVHVGGRTFREKGERYIMPSEYGETFTKTGGTITGYTGDTVNGNVVKDSSGTEQRFKGHAVYAGNPSVLMKIKEGTAGPGANMSYDGTKRPPTASGAWDN